MFIVGSGFSLSPGQPLCCRLASCIWQTQSRREQVVWQPKTFCVVLLFAWRPPWAFVKLSDFQMRMRSGCYLSQHIRKFALICQIITHAQRQKSELASFSPSYVSFDLWLPGLLKLIHAACLDCAWCSPLQILVLPKPQPFTQGHL